MTIRTILFATATVCAASTSWASDIYLPPMLHMSPNGSVNAADPIVVAGHDETAVTNTLTSSGGAGGKSVVIGVDSGAAGVVTSVKVYNFGGDGVALEGLELDVRGCGRDWQGNDLFDDIHSLQDNPTPPGIKKLVCTPGSVTAIPGGLVSNQVDAPLFLQALFDITKSEDITPDQNAGDGGNSDGTGINKAAIMGCVSSQSCELRSDAKCTHGIKDRTTFFNNVPTFQFDHACAWFGRPHGILQFGALARKTDGTTPVLDASKYMTDISKALVGNQSLMATDYGGALYWQWGLRVTADLANNFPQVMWRSNGVWQYHDGTDSSPFNCETYRDTTFRHTDNTTIINGGYTNCAPDNYVMMISTGTDPATSFAIGIYDPPPDAASCDAAWNKYQTLVVGYGGTYIPDNRAAQQHFRFISQTNADPDYGDHFRKLLTFQRTSGVIVGRGQGTILRHRHWVPFGTPNDIMAGIVAWQGACHTGDE